MTLIDRIGKLPTLFSGDGNLPTLFQDWKLVHLCRHVKINPGLISSFCFGIVLKAGF